jgi:hypothetical protein
MKPWPNRSWILAGAATLILAIPALSQEVPESLLPPGFDDPQGPPQVRDEPEPGPQPGPRRPVQPAPRLPFALPPLEGTVVEDASQLDLEALAALAAPKAIELPEWARRSPDRIGPLGPTNWGMDEDAWGRARGPFLSTLMRELDAPLPSRWMSILLRRALLSRVPTPDGLSPADWVAERSWLLLRMGEADGARMLVQAVDVEDFTPKMFAIAVQTALATSDPAGLCPLVEPGRRASDEPVWPLADAMCAALAGEPSRAAALIDQARRSSGAGGIDLELAEKVIGAGTDTRRAVTIQWEPVDRLNSWRFGMASATGLTIPDRLLATAGPHVRAWQARAPMLPLEDRLAASDIAASIGVFSNASLVEIYSLIADTTDPSDFRESVGGRLRAAYVGADDGDRIAAMRDLWRDGDDDPVRRHARLILTAAAAARVAPSEQHAEDAVDLIASMLTAGLDRQAARWADVVATMEGDDGHRAWAMLAIASPTPPGDISTSRIGSHAEADDSRGSIRSKLLVAALAGLNRISEDEAAGLAEEFDIRLGRRNRWTAMIDSAAQRRQPATVALLAAIGMQTGGWTGVPPEHLYHIVRALRLTGYEYEARMIAAEAIARL